MRLHGGSLNGLILSCLWLAYLAVEVSLVTGFLGGVGVVSIGGGRVGGLSDLHWFGSLCTIVLDSGSLFIRIAYLLVMSSAWSLRGGTEASISRAYVGVVLKAAQISFSALCCTCSRGFAWHFVLFHHVVHV